jgi:hypothetical protein
MSTTEPPAEPTPEGDEPQDFTRPDYVRPEGEENDAAPVTEPEDDVDEEGEDDE